MLIKNNIKKKYKPTCIDNNEKRVKYSTTMRSTHIRVYTIF